MLLLASQILSQRVHSLSSGCSGGSSEEKKHFLGAWPTYYFTLWACCDVRLYPEDLQGSEATPRKPGSPGEMQSVLGGLGGRMALKAGLAFLTSSEKESSTFVNILEEAGKTDGSGVQSTSAVSAKTSPPFNRT